MAGFDAGMETQITGINSQLQQAVGYLTTIKSLTSDIARNSSGISFTNGNTGSGGSVMPSMGAFSNNAGVQSAMASMGATSSKLGLAGQVAGAVIGGVGAVAGLGLAAMPATADVLKYSSGYYNAAQFGGGRSGYQIGNATFSMMKGGITSRGGDAAIANQLASQGIMPGGSQYNQTVTSVANAAKYLNMDNSAATAAITGMNSGSMSSNLMKRYGIRTSNWSTGEALPMGDIFSQLDARFTAGQRQATEQEIMDSFQRGKLGASLAGTGMSADQQQLFLQYELEKARGNNLDLSNQAGMDALQAAKDKRLGVNPNKPALDVLSSDTSVLAAAQETYLKGAQEGAKFVETANDFIKSQLIPTLGEFKAALDTAASSAGVGGAMGQLGSALGGLTGAIGSILSAIGGYKLLSAASKALTSGAPAAIEAGAQAAGKLGPVGAEVLPKAAAAGAKLGVRGAAAIAAIPAGLALNVAMTQSNINDLRESGMTSGNIVTTMATTGAQDAGFMRDNGSLSNLQNADVFGAFGSWWDSLWGGGNGSKGGGAANTTPGSGTRTNNSPNKSLKFKWPVNGQFTDSFGPRGAVAGQANFHNGQDIAAPQGTPIGASEAGTVVEVSSQDLGGKYVKIKHSNGYTTGYFHQSAQKAVVGKEVKQGETIGLVGATGAATGPHVHFTVQDASGAFIDPKKVVSGTVTSSPAGDTTSEDKENGKGAPSRPMSTAGSTESMADKHARKDSMSVAGLRMGGGGGSNPGSTVSVSSGGQGGGGTSSGRGGSGRLAGMYQPGAPRAKYGDPYVAQDGPVNVHAGEAILTAEQAAQWRDGMRGQGKGKGNNVTINLTVASASEAEARKFAQTVKKLLEEDRMVGRMGRN